MNGEGQKIGQVVALCVIQRMTLGGQLEIIFIVALALTCLLAYLLTYLLIYLLHAAQSFLRN